MHVIQFTPTFNSKYKRTQALPRMVGSCRHMFHRMSQLMLSFCSNSLFICVAENIDDVVDIWPAWLLFLITFMAFMLVRRPNEPNDILPVEIFLIILFDRLASPSQYSCDMFTLIFHNYFFIFFKLRLAQIL